MAPQISSETVPRPHRVDMGQFYITNVCNLGCNNCISFNNFRFHDHLSWSHSQARVEQWARILDIDYLCIIGGEPMANPELATWVTQLRRLWPHTSTEFSIVTNGTYLAQWDQAQIKDWWDQAVTLEISCHDPAQWYQHIQWASTLLKDLSQPWTLQIDYHDGVLTHNYCLSDGTRLIALGQHWLFGPNAVRSVTERGLEFHDSDVVTAHSNCPARLCHYFVNGVMYKCPVTATAAMLTKQFQMLDHQRELLLRSRGLDPLTAADLDHWFHSLDQPVAQCRLCPEHWPERQPIWPLPDKKPQVARISLNSLTKAQARLGTPSADAGPPNSNSQV